MHILLPGDHLPQEFNTPTVTLGPGLLQEQEIISCKAGVLISMNDSVAVDNKQKRYIPVMGESVIGMIVSKHAENYRVDIGCAHSASLPLLAFEGATKRNRPNLNVGSLIYARIQQANKDMEPELECVHPSGKSMGYGELKDGFMITVSLKLARDLLKPQNAILKELQKTLAFELAVGMNGRVWLNAETSKQIILISNILKNADSMSESKQASMAKKAIKNYAK